MARRSIAVLLALAAALTTAGDAWAAKKKKVDQLALARVLLLDGHPDRAVAILAEINPEQDQVDLAEFYRLRGLAQHDLGLHTDAAASFQLAMKNGENTPATWYALTNAQSAAGDHRGALATLAKSPPEVWALPGAHRVKSHAHYQLGEKYRAFEASDVGFARFPNEVELERLRVLLFLELGLSQEGLAAARRMLARPQITAKDYVALAAAMASARDLRRAAELLEDALLRYPEARDVREQLAKMYFEARRPLSAARVLHVLAMEEPASALLAAELYRKAGKIDAALRMNALVTDQKSKVRQRLTLLIEAERYHEAAALDQRVARLGLLSDEKLLYALAYAQFVAGNKSRTEQLLGRVSEPDLFEKAVAIRGALEACSSDIWKCD